MGMGETAELVADLSLKGNFNRDMKTAAASTTKLERNIDKITKRTGAFSGFLNRNLSRAVDSLGVRLIGAVGTGLQEMATLEDAATSVAGAIRQVGPAWTTTADDIVDAANRIERETDAAFDDKAIVAASETLIRYGKVTEDNLIPAIEVMTDLAAKTGDVDSAATLLAKALADPEKAAGKLARQGIILTEAQQDQIKAMVKAGDTAGAQALLLRELEKTTKGAAAASAGPYRDALNKLGDAGEDLRRAFTVGLAPALLEVSDLLTDELAKPSTVEALKTAGKELGGTLKSLIGIAKSLPWETIGTSLQIAGTGAKAVLDAFLGLPPWIQTAVLTGWGLNKLTGGLLGDIASNLVKGVLGIRAGVVNVSGPVSGLGGAAAPAGGVASRALSAVRILGAVTIAGASIVALAQAFGDFQTTVTESQESLQDKVDRTQSQNFKQTLDNLRATNKNLERMNGFEEIIASGFGGGQITKNFEMAAERIVTAQGLTRSQTIGALDALKDSQQQARELLLKTPTLDAAILTLERRLAGRPEPGSSGGRGGAPGAFRPSPEAKAQTAKTQAVVNAVKNAQSIASRENSAAKGELSNIKNTLSTQSAEARAQAVAQIAADNAHAAVQSFQNLGIQLAQAGTTRSVDAGTSATRGVAPPIVGALSAGFAGLRSTIWAARPQITVQSTTVVQKYTTSERGGASSDSRTRSGV